MAGFPLAGARREVRRLRRGPVALGVVAAWILLWFPLHGRDTLALPPADLTGVHTRLNELRDSVERHRASSRLFTGFVDVIRSGIDHLTTFLQHLISQPAYDRPVPLLGWLGVVALATLAAYALAGAAPAGLTCAGFGAFGGLGLWTESMDTLALTLAAVLVSLAVAIPLGVWAGLSDTVHRLLTPVLDLMQAMPTFVYLAPLSLFFLIGPASAVIATMVYAAPPAIRITDHAVRGVPAAPLEASESLGATRWQSLRKVRLPLARRTIVVGVNQTTMAALAMVTIAALIDAPGLGQTVIQALQTLDVGTAANAGLAIVIMAVVLDRVTTAASVRAETAQRAAGPAGRARARRLRRACLAAMAVLTGIAAYLSYTFVWAAEFPRTRDGGAFGHYVVSGVDTASDWVQRHFSGVTGGIKDGFTYALLNPFQSLLADSPWYLVAAVVLALAVVLGGRMALAAAAVCVGLLLATGLWSDAMVTLAATLVATVLVLAFGVVLGVWMGRSDRADRIVRPTLDAGQVMPAFVYLVPFLWLFGATRFTAIVAAVVYAAPVVTKLVADGIRGVPADVVEAAVAAGSNAWQVIAKVQLPMARRSLTLAANQGLIYVLSMVVVGGLVGAGALGYLVVAGFSQGELYGKGLAAGAAIVLLGVLLDRITQAAARRMGGEPGRPIT